MGLKLTWRDVFDSNKLFPKTYDECRIVALSVNYKYMVFNGLVYANTDTSMKNPICSIDELKG